MNRGLMMRLLAVVVWLTAALAGFGVLDQGVDALGEQELFVILAGVAVIFALDVWGWVKRDGK